MGNAIPQQADVACSGFPNAGHHWAGVHFWIRTASISGIVTCAQYLRKYVIIIQIVVALETLNQRLRRLLRLFGAHESAHYLRVPHDASPPAHRARQAARHKSRPKPRNAEMLIEKVQLRPRPIVRAPASRQGDRPLDPSSPRRRRMEPGGSPVGPPAKRSSTRSAAALVEIYQPTHSTIMKHHSTFPERQRALAFIATTLPTIATRLAEYAAVIQREAELMQEAHERFARRQQQRQSPRGTKANR